MPFQQHPLHGRGVIVIPNIYCIFFVFLTSASSLVVVSSGSPGRFCLCVLGGPMTLASGLLVAFTLKTFAGGVFSRAEGSVRCMWLSAITTGMFGSTSSMAFLWYFLMGTLLLGLINLKVFCNGNMGMAYFEHSNSCCSKVKCKQLLDEVCVT